ncbi:MAG TPA: DUF1343 domain-containing protein [Chthoniobacterales bacterium]|jgi:uncharacterized protein YbbC (DUF1343 family)
MFSHRFLLVVCLVLTWVAAARAEVMLGIDVLEANGFDFLQGKRVGLITNQTGVNSNGVKTRKILHNAKGVKLVSLFSPEHGLDGTEKAGKYVASKTDALTGLPAHSLYGPTRKPSAAMLKGIDTLVFDMQDIGSRTYTYISTMGKCMQAAAEAGIDFVVLDRPNPLGGNRVEGPGIEKEWISFVGQFPVPYVHGLTTGELAQMSNARGWMGSKCNLKVVKMRGWNRSMTWPDTGLRWVQTSPNIPRATSPFYYVLTGLIGELNPAELGINTSEPFEIIAAKWIDAEEFSTVLNRLDTPGVKFSPVSDFRGANGVRIRIEPNNRTDLCALSMHMLAYMNKTAGTPNIFARSNAGAVDLFYKSCGSKAIRRQIEAGMEPEAIAATWEPSLRKFRSEREKYLLY